MSKATKPGARDGSKTATVLELLRRKGGAPRGRRARLQHWLKPKPAFFPPSAGSTPALFLLSGSGFWVTVAAPGRHTEHFSVPHIDQNSIRTASCITRGSRAAVYCPNCAFTWLPLAAN